MSGGAAKVSGEAMRGLGSTGKDKIQGRAVITNNCNLLESDDVKFCSSAVINHNWLILCNTLLFRFSQMKGK